MKSALVKIIRLIIGLFDRIIDKEAKRVDEFNSQCFEEDWRAAKIIKGGYGKYDWLDASVCINHYGACKKYH